MSQRQPIDDQTTTDSVDQRTFEQLFAAARAGDSDSVAELVDRYRPYLLLIANEDIDQTTRAKTAASDVVQETMIHAQTGFNGFVGTSEVEFRSWIRAILKHDLLKTQRGYYTRKRNVHSEINLQEQSAVGHGLVDPALTPSTNAAENEKMMLLARAFQHLSEDHQQVIQLRNLEGLAFDEIGRRMNRGADAACKLWARAIESLRKRLDALAPGLFNESDCLL